MTVHTNSVPAKKASVALIRNWPLTLLSGLLLPLLLSLGFWQLQRAEEKSALNATIDTRLASQPRSLANSAAELTGLQTYMPVRLLGFYTDEYYLLDNRTRNGRVGYEVLQVFVSARQRWLVNRGWLEAPPQRDELPEVDWPLAAKVITGFLYPVAPGDSESRPETDTRIQQLDSTFAGSLDLLQPQWSIRLSADSDTALVTDWQLVNSPPQRHRAYAAQWFAMAVALVILWLAAATSAATFVRKVPQLLRKQ
ncbi:SURF1 family protein [Microbulbifer magnicolonia]|uniref:SURF1 family protein n=1 Tax=Microbulbifer magnicolonia TaxID=3109744 RepID=UPI002B41249A|nr:SURF1 family protein [Microbulbifer sp. GG15]